MLPATHDTARDGDFSEATKKYLEARNKNNVVIIGIGSVPAINNVEKTLNVGGIDRIFIGPNDLSITLGIPDAYAHPRFILIGSRCPVASRREYAC